MFHLSLYNIFIFIRRNRQQKNKTNKQTNEQTNIQRKYKNSNEEHRNSDIKELYGIIMKQYQLHKYCRSAATVRVKYNYIMVR